MFVCESGSFFGFADKRRSLTEKKLEVDDDSLSLWSMDLVIIIINIIIVLFAPKRKDIEDQL